MVRRPGTALVGALVAIGALVATWALAFHSAAAHRLDASVLRGFLGLDRGRVTHLAHGIAHLCDPQPFVVFSAILIGIALVRRRPRVALAVAVILAGANVTTQLLKPALAAPRFSGTLGFFGQIDAVSWPSGHATAAMSLALCAVLVTPARRRPLVAAAGAVFAVAVVFSFLTLRWHYPSDVLGGFLVATAWTLSGVAAVWWADARWPRRHSSTTATAPSRSEALAPAMLAALAALLLFGLVLLARPEQVVSYARGHTTFVIGAGAIALLGLALVTGLALATGSGPAPTAARRRRSPRGSG
jgi:membrane-associated phospholipid phosphatase